MNRINITNGQNGIPSKFRWVKIEIEQKQCCSKAMDPKEAPRAAGPEKPTKDKKVK